ncbi:MAG: helix-turn-helix domain-containing protein [Caulobacteraceae bacterium]
MTDLSAPGRSPARPGGVLKSLRLQRGWTLAEVSRRTGLPVSTLSKVENDKMSLTYDKLTRLSEGLEVDIARFFGARDVDPSRPSGGRRSISRAGQGKSIETANYGHLYPASDLLNKRFIPLLAEIRARTLEEFGELIRHSGEEYTYVLEGEVELHTDVYAPLRLAAGDSIYFDSRMGHAYLAVSKGPCRVLSICSAGEAQLLAALGGEAAESEAPPAARGPARPMRSRRRA